MLGHLPFATGALCDFERDRQPLLDCGHHALLHLRRRPPVAEADNAASRPALSPAAATPGVAHQLVDHSGRDAGVLQPGRERVPQVVGTAQLEAGDATCLIGRDSEEGVAAMATWGLWRRMFIAAGPLVHAGSPE
jgi:hypothetical protein